MYGCICTLISIALTTVWSIITAWKIVSCLILVVFSIYIYLTWTFHSFDAKIPGPNPVPVFGTMVPLLMQGIRAADNFLIQKYSKIVATFEGRCPVLLVTDTQLLRQIMVKEFNSFTNRRGGNTSQPPFNKALTNLKGVEWKRVRAIMTPAFNSKRLKQLLPLIKRSASAINLQLAKKESLKSINISHLSAIYSMDVLASTILGLDLSGADEHNSKLVRYGMQALKFNVNRIKALALLTVPFCDWLFKFLNITIYPKEATAYLIKTVDELITQHNNNKSPWSILKYLMTAKRLASRSCDSSIDRCPIASLQNNCDTSKYGDTDEESTCLSDEEIRSQSILLFLAGFENMSRSLAFTLHCFATHQHSQDKARQDIKDKLRDEKRLRLEVVNSMSYLDMCVSESLRLYPPAVRVNRVCSKTTHLDDITINAGTSVVIPIHSLHRDASLWENPDSFNPERFEDPCLNKKSTYNWMPFGAGPRHCIGMRLAVLQMKVFLVKLLQNYRVVPSIHTQIPLEVKPHGILQPTDDILLDLETI